jgi:hypothetical protein
VYFPGEGITGQVDNLARPIIVPRIGDEPGFLNRTGSLTRTEDRDRAFLCVPILRGKKVLGSISAIRPFDTEEMMRKRAGALAVVANMLAQAVELYLLENVDKVVWERRFQDLMDELRTRFKPSNVIGTSKAMMEVFALMHKVAQTRTPGPTGRWSGQLRGPARAHPGERAVRARERRLHRRGPAAQGTLRGSRRRDDLPGRGRGAVPRGPGQVPARAPGAAVRAGGRQPHHHREHPGHRRHQP